MISYDSGNRLENNRCNIGNIHACAYNYNIMQVDCTRGPGAVVALIICS